MILLLLTKDIEDSNDILQAATATAGAVSTDDQSEHETSSDNLTERKIKKKQVTRNKFELLAAEEEEEANANEDPDPPSEGDANDKGLNAKRNRKNQKRKKKKKNHKVEESDAVEKMPEPLNKEPSNAKIAAKNSASVYKPLTPEIIRLMKIEELLSVDSKLLNPEFELKKMFGSKVINQELTGGRFPNNKYRKNKLYRRGKLVFRKERPIPVTGITMKLIDTDEESGQKIFKFNHSSTYRDIQKQFLVAVDSYNPDFIVNLLRNYPYHIDAHIQVS